MKAGIKLGEVREKGVLGGEREMGGRRAMSEFRRPRNVNPLCMSPSND